LGLPCLWDRTEGEERSRACQQMLDGGSWELVDQLQITGDVHDDAAGRPPQGGSVALYRRKETAAVPAAGAAP
jgi:hypothetical protein